MKRNKVNIALEISKLFLIICGALCNSGFAKSSDLLGPKFVSLPDAKIRFSNSSGTELHCQAEGNPTPIIEWRFGSTDESDVTAVQKVVELLSISVDNSSIHFRPFPSNKYSSKIHSTFYQCFAINSVGVIASPAIDVRAVVDQEYDLQVFPSYAYAGNTAVLKCLMAPFVKEFLVVTSWMWGSKVINTDIQTGGRYSILSNGDLHIRNVSAEDGKEPYRCLARHRLTGEKTLSSVAGRLTVQTVEQAGTVPAKISDPISPEIFAVQGTSLEIPCVGVGLPTPEYTWFKRQGLAGVSRSVTSGVDRDLKLNGGSLFIPRLDKSQHEGLWTCQVKNDLGYDNKTVKLTVTAPLSVEIVPDRVRVNVGDDVNISCQINGFPIRQIRWIRNGRIILNENVSDRNETETRLRRDGNGIYKNGSKVVETNVKRDESADDGVDDVARERRGLLTLQLRKHHSEDEIGEDQELEDHQRQQQQQQQQPNELENNSRISWDGKDLIIRDVRREDRGVYQCLAYGLYEEVAMKTFQLDLGDSRPYIDSIFNYQLVNEGQPLSFECLASGTPIPTLSWLLDGKILSPSSVLGLHTKTHSDGEHISLTLSMTRVNVRHSGVYTCRAVNPRGVTEKSERLDVVGEPFVRAMDPLSVVAETSVWIHCPYGGYPIAKIEWSKDGEDLPVNERQLVYKNGSLLLVGISRDDAGTYRCSVTSNKQLRSSGDVVVTVMVAPQIEPFAFASGLQEGGRTRVSCTAHLGDLPIKFDWFFGEEELIGAELNKMNGVIISGVNPFTSSLSFPKLKTEHSGNYSCIASNAAAKHSQSATLVVNVPPRWILPPTDVQVMLGDRVSLDCLVSGTPRPLIKWSIADAKIPGKFHEIQNIVKDFRILSNGTLAIEKSQASHEGHYLCKADNGVVHGSTLSKLAEIKVNVPAFFAEPVANASVVVGEKATLECPVEGDNPIRVTWLRNEKVLQSDESNFKVKEEISSNGMISKLIVKKTRRQDSAIFHCLAENKFGKSQRTISLTIQEVPEVPDSFQLVSSSSRTANVTWKIPYNGNAIISEFQVQYKRNQETWSLLQRHSTSGNSTWTELHTLSPAMQYNLRLVAINSVGTSHPSRTIDLTTKEEMPEGPPTDVEATAPNSQSLVITWKPPHPEKQNGRILGYYLGYKVANSSEPFRYLSLEDVNQRLELLVDHLKKFTQYSIVVQAFNRIGAGPRSQEITVSTSEDVPSSPPRHVQCTPLTSTSLLIIWSPPPVTDMNGILTDYRIFYRPLKEWTERVEIFEQSTLQHKISVSGLEKYQNYSIQVVASTKVGPGLKSRSIYCRTKEDLPGPPSNIKAISLDQNSVLVSWMEPVNPNGQITNYRVYMKTMENGRQYTQHFDLFQPEETYYSVRGLNQNQPYSFWVTASTVQGEGSESAIVAETPQLPVPATIASFSRKIIHAIKEDAVLKCLAVGQPKPTVEWKINGLNLEQTDRVRVEAGGSAVRITRLTLKDSANYSCSAQNHFGFDQITYALVVKLSRNNGVPPAPPTLAITSTTGSTISLGWTPAPDGGAPLIAYHIHYHREFGDWDRVDVSPRDTSFTLTGLRCGTNYQFYLQAINDFGVGERTETISARTQGSAPLSPSTSRDFLRVNSTSIVLNLSKWQNGGCPISSFVVEYRVRVATSSISNLEDDSSSWILVNNNVKPILQNSKEFGTESAPISSGGSYFFSVLDLMPETRYTLRMTAHNSAGSTVHEYDFTTLTFSGATIAPELIIHSEFGGSFLTNPGFLVPVLSALIVAIGLGAGLVWYWRKNSLREPSKSERAVSESDLIQGCQIVNSDLHHPSLPHLLAQHSEPNNKELQIQPMRDHFSGYSTLDSRCINVHTMRNNLQQADRMSQQQFIMSTLSRKNSSPRYQIDYGGFRNSSHHSNLYEGEPIQILHTSANQLLQQQQQLQQQQHSVNVTPVRFYSPCYAEPSPGLGCDGYATIKSEEESERDEEEGRQSESNGTDAETSVQQWIPMRQLFNAHRL